MVLKPHKRNPFFLLNFRVHVVSNVDHTHTSTSSNLLANVSIDTEMMDSFSDDVIGSIDIGDISDPTPPPTLIHPSDLQREVTASNLRNPEHPDYMEVQSVTSAASRMTDHSAREESRSSNMEPLLPARLKPAKEKTNNHSKDQERSHAVDRKSPTRRDVDIINRESKSPTRSKGKSSDSAGSFSLSEDSSVTDSITPLPEDMLSDTETSQRGTVDKPNYTVFSISGTYSPDRNVDKSTDSVKLSYTIQDQVYTPETARAAGIPVVLDSAEKSTFALTELKRSGSREGSVCSRSSSEFSDHESHKIHKDHKIKESEDVKTPTNVTVKKPEMLIIKTDLDSKPKPDKRILTTNFAEIRRLKQGISNVDNSGFVFMQHGHEPTNGESKKSSLRDPNSNGAKSGKKTSFAPSSSSNRTTWQQTLQGPSSSGEPARTEEPPVPSELLQIKMKLEEKRKLIERKKQRNEIQQQRLRQKLGKTAFLHVLKKPGEIENGLPEEIQEEARSSSSGSFEDVSGTQRPEIQAERQNPPARKEHSPSPARNLSDECDEGLANGNNISQRPFSREGIQQTIENVRKKWFKDDAEVVTQAYAEKPETPDSPPPFEKQRHAPEKPKSMQDYNTSLDKFNRNLSDLQIEINRLSLQQEQIKQQRGLPPPVPQRVPAQRNIPQDHPQHSIPSTPQNMPRGPEISYHPQHMQAQQIPVGPVVPSQNQFMPVTCTGHNQFVPSYNGYQQGFSPSYPYPPAQQQMFGQSPPYPVGSQLGMTPLISSPHSQGVVPAFSPMGPGITTATIQPSVMPSSHVGAQMYQPFPQNQPLTSMTSHATSVHSIDRSVPTNVDSQTRLSGHFENVPHTAGHHEATSHVTPQTRESLSTLDDSKRKNAQQHSNSVISGDSQINNVSLNQSDVREEPPSSNNEFFVSFNEGTPKPKPELGKNRKQMDQPSSDGNDQGNSNQNQSVLDSSSRNQNVSQGSDMSSQNISGADGSNTSGIGFVIGQDQTSIDQVRYILV